MSQQITDQRLNTLICTAEAALALKPDNRIGADMLAALKELRERRTKEAGS